MRVVRMMNSQTAQFIRTCIFSLLTLSASDFAIAEVKKVEAQKPKSYFAHSSYSAFANDMMQKHGFTEEHLSKTFGDAYRQQSIIDAMTRPAEKTKTWAEYRPIFVTPDQIKKGINFCKQHEATLQKAEKEFGVPAEIMISIIGVETRFGTFKGKYRVIDAISTLAFDYPPRSDFFFKQLEEYLLLARELKVETSSILGSYAGAIGYPQFIPSSYRNFAVDFDGNKHIDLVNSPIDAIGSVGNYFKEHGWQAGAPTVDRIAVDSKLREKVNTASNKGLELTLSQKDLTELGIIYNAKAEKFALFLFEGTKGPEYWLGYPNFYTITRYNHSQLYAMAVYQLAQNISEKIKQEKSCAI
ncbi:MAG: lytic murein transglycosylase B [Pseudomonadota bacterium]